jgi:uncharacterized coiled-coil DUF342 family protein
MVGLKFYSKFRADLCAERIAAGSPGVKVWVTYEPTTLPLGKVVNDELVALKDRITELESKLRDNACPHVVESGESRYCALAESSVRELEAKLREAEQFARDIATKLDIPYEPPVAKGACAYLVALEEMKAQLREAEQRNVKLEAELREASELLETPIGYGVGLRCVAEAVRVVLTRLREAEAARDVMARESNRWRDLFSLNSDDVSVRLVEADAERETKDTAIVEAVRQRDEWMSRCKEAEAKAEALLQQRDGMANIAGEFRDSLTAAEAENERLRKIVDDWRVCADGRAVRNDRLRAALEDCWDQFAIERPDGTKWAGGLSTLEEVGRVLFAPQPQEELQLRAATIREEKSSEPISSNDSRTV